MLGLENTVWNNELLGPDSAVSVGWAVLPMGFTWMESLLGPGGELAVVCLDAGSVQLSWFE